MENNWKLFWDRRIMKLREISKNEQPPQIEKNCNSSSFTDLTSVTSNSILFGSTLCSTSTHPSDQSSLFPGVKVKKEPPQAIIVEILPNYESKDSEKTIQDDVKEFKNDMTDIGSITIASSESNLDVYEHKKAWPIDVLRDPKKTEGYLGSFDQNFTNNTTNIIHEGLVSSNNNQQNSISSVDTKATSRIAHIQKPNQILVHPTRHKETEALISNSHPNKTSSCKKEPLNALQDRITISSKSIKEGIDFRKRIKISMFTSETDTNTFKETFDKKFPDSYEEFESIQNQGTKQFSIFITLVNPNTIIDIFNEFDGNIWFHNKNNKEHHSYLRIEYAKNQNPIRASLARHSTITSINYAINPPLSSSFSSDSQPTAISLSIEGPLAPTYVDQSLGSTEVMTRGELHSSSRPIRKKEKHARDWDVSPTAVPTLFGSNSSDETIPTITTTSPTSSAFSSHHTSPKALTALSTTSETRETGTGTMTVTGTVTERERGNREESVDRVELSRNDRLGDASLGSPNNSQSQHNSSLFDRHTEGDHLSVRTTQDDDTRNARSSSRSRVPEPIVTPYIDRSSSRDISNHSSSNNNNHYNQKRNRREFEENRVDSDPAFEHLKLIKRRNSLRGFEIRYNSNFFGYDERTCVEMRNIPDHVSDSDFMDVMDKFYPHRYDAIRLYRTSCIINFISPRFVYAFYKHFNNKPFLNSSSKRIVTVGYCLYQPRNETAINLENVLNGVDTRKKIVIENVPNSVSELSFLKLLNINLRGMFESVTVGVSKESNNSRNMIIILTEPGYLVYFYNELEGRKFDLKSPCCAVLRYSKNQNHIPVANSSFPASCQPFTEDLTIYPEKLRNKTDKRRLIQLRNLPSDRTQNEIEYEICSDFKNTYDHLSSITTDDHQRIVLIRFADSQYIYPFFQQYNLKIWPREWSNNISDKKTIVMFAPNDIYSNSVSVEKHREASTDIDSINRFKDNSPSVASTAETGYSQGPLQPLNRDARASYRTESSERIPIAESEIASEEDSDDDSSEGSEDSPDERVSGRPTAKNILENFLRLFEFGSLGRLFSTRHCGKGHNRTFKAQFTPFPEGLFRKKGMLELISAVGERKKSPKAALESVSTVVLKRIETCIRQIEDHQNPTYPSTNPQKVVSHWDRIREDWEKYKHRNELRSKAFSLSQSNKKIRVESTINESQPISFHSVSSQDPASIQMDGPQITSSIAAEVSQNQIHYGHIADPSDIPISQSLPEGTEAMVGTVEIASEQQAQQLNLLNHTYVYPYQSTAHDQLYHSAFQSYVTNEIPGDTTGGCSSAMTMNLESQPPTPPLGLDTQPLPNNPFPADFRMTQITIAGVGLSTSKPALRRRTVRPAVAQHCSS